MVKVLRQSMAPQRKREGSIKDRVVPVAKMAADGIRINIYGRSKTGKTRLASTFPKPLLLVGTERGTRSVGRVSEIDFVPLVRSAEIDEIVDLAKEGRYRSLVLDTAGGMQDLILREVLGIDELPIQRSWGMAERDHWSTCGIQTKERLKQLLDLAQTHATNVVIVAHERNFNEESNTDLIAPTVGSALTPSVTNWLNGACDYIAQCFIREATQVRKVKMAGKTMLTKVREGVEFCLRVGPDPVYMTGFRLPPGVELPDVLVNPSFEAVDRLIRGAASAGSDKKTR